MRVTVTCESCNEHMQLERLILEPETIPLVCHNCEAWLKVVIPASSFKRNPVKDPFAFLRR